MNQETPLAIDLYCGLGGWAEGLLSEGWRVVGFDIERHDYGTGGYPGQLVIQDVLTLHGSQFRGASLIVASPPCQAYSYRAMPWSRAKALPPPDNSLFDACFRIQREASEAAGRHIPLIVENVRGAVKWVSQPVKWHFGSYYLWGDVPALMPITFRGMRKTPVGSWDTTRKNYNPDHSWDEGQKQPGRNFHFPEKYGIPSPSFHGAEHETSVREALGLKTVGHANIRDGHTHTRHLTNQRESDGLKVPGNKLSENGFTIPVARTIDQSLKPETFALNAEDKRQHLSFSRKAASAMIAKIPFPLAQHIAQTFKELGT